MAGALHFASTGQYTGVASMAISLGTETSHARVATVTLKDADGNAITNQVAVRFFVSDNAFDVLCASAPSSGLSLNSNNKLIQTVVSNKDLWAWSYTDGTLKVTVTEATAKTFYLQAVCGSIAVSAACAFAG